MDSCCTENTFWYTAAIRACLQAKVDAGLMVHLVSAAYQPVEGAHETTDHIPSAAILASQPLSATVGGRVIHGQNVIFPGSSAQRNEIRGIVIATADGMLLAHLGDVQGLNIAPDGTDLELKWDPAGVLGL